MKVRTVEFNWNLLSPEDVRTKHDLGVIAEELATGRASLDTTFEQRRREIVLSYLNTVPLSAKPGFGEVNGLGDGLWAWYGRDFDEVNRLLAAAGTRRPAT